MSHEAAIKKAVQSKLDNCEKELSYAKNYFHNVKENHLHMLKIHGIDPVGKSNLSEAATNILMLEREIVLLKWVLTL